MFTDNNLDWLKSPSSSVCSAVSPADTGEFGDGHEHLDASALVSRTITMNQLAPHVGTSRAYPQVHHVT